MAKRKANVDVDSDDSGSEASIVNISFDFHPPAAIDYAALKNLFNQLFHSDAHLFNTHELTDLVLSPAMAGIGSTVKEASDEEGGADGVDPYAIITVLNMHEHKANPAIQEIGAYLIQKSGSNPQLHALLQQLFAQTESHVGLLLCERLINMPVQIIPPMYRMLVEEIEAAVAEGRPFKFSHVLIISRTYHLSLADEETLSARSNATKKKKKTKRGGQAQEGQRPDDGVYPFHPEDEVVSSFSSHTVNYPFTTQANPQRTEESFGLDTRGRLMLIPIENVPAMVQKMNEVYAP